ncbi:hypothetical protein RND71_030110 [Anisodus tanguticus]|uniref:Aminotransferase-like plant mobile domain-containing protein n=1 Tax=Anisodus tanguticus TaxID=243964 RepID=A0AAE1V0S6_9SOLA|nr:hypothetical protein RND71_030110 [Anisodus tanguticus]
MVSRTPSKLRVWWENFDLGSQMAIRRKLGCLISLFDITPDQHLVRALIHFWDPDRVVFKFKDFELTPTLEAINYFTNLIYQDRGQIIPHGQSGKKFLRYLGLKNTKKLRCFENNWVSLEYLYERYGRRDSYKSFRKEFSCTPDHWQARRPIAFAVALLGILVFPLEHGKISTCICSVARAIFEGIDGAQLTLVPMILAEILRALGKCKRGKTNFFKGCNLILQMWAIEHFYQRSNMTDICFSESNKTASFYDRTKHFLSPVGVKDWYEFLASRISYQIQWKYPLLPNAKKAYMRCKRLYYIELIGLKGLQPYAPLRVLRQFGQKQIIPLQANMRVSEIQFGPNFIVPRTVQILHEWNSVDKIDVGDGQAGTTPEYCAWLREGHDNSDLSPEGESGFEDVGTTIWIRTCRLKNTVITPEMWSQMQDIVQYLENAGAGPSSVRAPSLSM